MRISDWSSDVCSSDLPREARTVARARHHAQHVHRAAGEHFIVAHFRIAAAERVTELLDVGKRQVRAPQRPLDRRAADTPHFRQRRNINVHLVAVVARSEEHTSELQSLMRTSYAVFCLKKTTTTTPPT